MALLLAIARIPVWEIVQRFYETWLHNLYGSPL